MNKTPPPSSNNDNEDNILKAVLAFVLFSAIAFILHLFAGVATYLYFSFTWLPWMIGSKLGAIGAGLVFLFYAIICLAINEVRKHSVEKKIKINPERSKSFVYLAGFWFIVAMVTFFSGDPKNSFMLEHVHRICNPSNDNLPFLSCEVGVSLWTGASLLDLFILLVPPNLVLAILIIPELFKGFYATTNHPEHKVKEKASISCLIRTLKDEYPPLSFYDKINPNRYPIDSGKFARLQQSREIALEQGLISGFTTRPTYTNSEIKNMSLKQEPDVFSIQALAKEEDDYIPIIDPDKFEDLMLSQLGKPWTGIDNLEPSEVVLMALTISQACSLEKQMSDEEAKSILKQTFSDLDDIWRWLSRSLDECCKIKKADLKGLKDKWPDGYDLDKLPLLIEYENYDALKNHLRRWLPHPIMVDIIKKHAYVTTIIYALILKARGVGVYQPASLRWMILYDRKLYALIQNVNRPSVYAEAAGPVSHYYSEIKVGEALLRPDLQAAYSGFCDRLQMFRYTKEDVAAFYAGELKFKIEYRKENFNDSPKGFYYLDENNQAVWFDSINHKE